jgi:hypothetical protein
MKYLDILSHRANGFGPENSLEAVRAALEHGFGVEIDIRTSTSGVLYVSHDMLRDYKGREFSGYLELFSLFPDRTVAINVKDAQAANDVMLLLERGLIPRGFAFDFELVGLESPRGGHAAVRVSDLPGERYHEISWEGVQFLWLDEMSDNWITADMLKVIGSQGQTYWVSPELHGRPWFERWRVLAPFRGLNGICTDYTHEFRTHFARLTR